MFPLHFTIARITAYDLPIISDFSRKIRGSKELNLPSIVEQTHVPDKYLEIFVD